MKNSKKHLFGIVFVVKYWKMNKKKNIDWKRMNAQYQASRKRGEANEKIPEF
ncbi:hypothetical protein HMPREF9394_2048 [Streptococcus sanguinis SK1057]|jgi:hypothetical protein|uniref:Uncharacterized protein n=2 Tax=Streptococcus sanguinis TaxID=1305 RepID=F0IRH7_STRSA|nr:hypothetical protein HMPREF9390_1836 [Streptococcus sanguinis SK405]EGC26090.1 hypothetical protein HMPREF9392_2006 [Streptococcus sanguinis SK678]EGD39493.1 hypothetical protein HMPREF9384_0439 [Streptococcus sanguinis SK160]EGF05337.1 hypothetical protein HMPREF9394_2048 [Streptococcus sanguinis SK1057]